VIRVFIIAESPTARAALENLLTRTPSSPRDLKSRARDSSTAVEVVGTGANLDALEGRELDGGIDALLIDTSGNPSAWLAEIRDTDLASDLPVILLSDQASAEWSSQALHDGIRSILPADTSAEQLLAAIQAATAGLIVLHPVDVNAAISAAAPVTASAIQPAIESTESLTRREREVLQMLAAGLGNKEIATRLNISDHTAKFHVASILGKLGASTRTEAVTAGIRRGLILL
jgi:two-component system, NarL family, response regulator YdfI